MRARSRPVAGVVVLVAVVAAVGGAVTGAIAGGGESVLDGDAVVTPSGEPRVDGPLASSAGSPPGDSVRDQIQTDIVRLRVTVGSDGDADWRVEYWTRLDDENVTAAFESLQSDIQARPGNYTRRFATRIRSTVDDAENATGRSMNASGFAVNAEVRTIPQEYGVITYSFEWSNFAAVSDGGDRIEVGDAIDGLFLDSKSRLTVEWPDAYGPVEVVPEPDDSGANAVVWRGESTEFVTGQPRVVLERGRTTTTTATTTTDGTTTDGTTTGGTTTGGPTTDGTTDTTEAAGGGGPSVAVIGLVVLALAGAGGAAWWYRSGGPVTTGGDGTGGGSEQDDDEQEQDDEDESEQTEDEETPPPVDDELLSNEERVLRLLERRGGRMKQQEVVDELDWTEAKTSQVVSGLREDDEIETFRLGRENVLTLPDEGDEDSI